MTTVTAFTAERSQAIEDATIVSAEVVGDNLILTRHDATEIDAGNVRGDPGADGFTAVANQAARLALTPAAGQFVVELDTGRLWQYIGGAWRWVVGSGTSPYLLTADHTAGTHVASGGTLAIPWVESVDRAAAFATPSYTCPVTAEYRISGAVRITPDSSAAFNPVVLLNVNAAQIARLAELTVASAGAQSMPFCYEGPLVAGDVVKLDYFSGALGSTLATGHTSTRLHIDVAGY